MAAGSAATCRREKLNGELVTVTVALPTTRDAQRPRDRCAAGIHRSLG